MRRRRRRIGTCAGGRAALLLGICALACDSGSEPPAALEIEAEAPEVEVVEEVEADPVDPAAARARAEALEQDTAEALAIFEVMSDFLGAKQQLHFAATVGWDAVQITGQKLEFGGRREVSVQRPDRARMESVRRDGQTSILIFDGARIWVDLPDDEVYVSVEKPGTLDEALDYLAKELRTPVPLADLVHSDVYAEVAGKVESGLWVEEALIGDSLCDHIAFRADRVDVQLWIEQGDRPVPHRVVITHRDEPGAPQFWADLGDWSFDAPAPDGHFGFTPGEGSEQIPFRAALDIAREEASQ